MPEDFDPYLAWLGIPANARPPSHYALLGLTEFEADAGKIAAAADARMAEVRSYQMGPRGSHTQKLLNELASAKLCLLDAASKRAYDAALQQRIAASSRWQAAMSPVMVPPAPAPPLVEPPTTPPPKTTAARRAAPALPQLNDDQEVRAPDASGSWLALASIFFLVIIAAAVGGVYWNAERQREQAAIEAERTIPSQPIPVPMPPVEDKVVFLMQEGSGDVNFPLSVAELSEGLTISTREGATLLSGWKDEMTFARWNFRLVRPAVFKIRIEYSAQNVESAEWQLRSGEETKTRGIEVSEGTETFTADEFFWPISRGGEQSLELSVSAIPEGGSVTLKSLRFVYQGGQTQ